MEFDGVIGFGVAGNFSGHLKQAGEEQDFLNIKVNNAIQPKALFPFYIPSEKAGFLATYPISSDIIRVPNDADNLQIEPEVAILFNITYENGKVVNLTPIKFAAYNDCSIRKPNAKKISEKKNWGANTKGLSQQFIELTTFTKGCELDHYHIASFHIRDNEINAYGEDSPTIEYSYFHEELTEWIIDRINHQKDEGPAENILQHIINAGYPEQTLISIGATRYLPFGEVNFLQPGDQSIIVVYDARLYSIQDINTMVAENSYNEYGLSVLKQTVSEYK